MSVNVQQSLRTSWHEGLRPIDPMAVGPVRMVLRDVFAIASLAAVVGIIVYLWLR